MLQIIKNKIHTGNPVLLPQWDLAVNESFKRLQSMKERFAIASFYETGGIRLLELMISQMQDNLDNLTKMSDDFERYKFGLEPIVASVSGMFGANFGGIVRENMFFEKKTPAIKELIVPTERMYPLTTLPLDEPFGLWENIPVVKILSHNSKEMPDNIDNTYIKMQQPIDFTIISIDVNVLAFKWIKYLHYLSDEMNTSMESLDNKSSYYEDFMQGYVMNTILDDLFEIWLINLVKTIADEWEYNNTPSTLFSKSIKSNRIVTGTFKNAVDSFTKVLDKLHDKNKTIADILYMQLINGKTIMNIINERLDVYTVDSSQQNLPYKFLDQLPIMELILDLIYINDNYDVNKSLILSLGRKMRSLLRKNLTGSVTSSTIRKQIKAGLESLDNKLQRIG